MRNVIALAMISIFLFGCTEEEKVYGGKNCLPKGDEAAELSKILTQNDLDFKFDEEEKCIYYNTKDRELVKASKATLFGTMPPSGRSTSFGSDNKTVEELLLKNGINITKSKYHGEIYITWSLADVEKVESLLQYSTERKEMLKKMREEG